MRELGQNRELQDNWADQQSSSLICGRQILLSYLTSAQPSRACLHSAHEPERDLASWSPRILSFLFQDWGWCSIRSLFTSMQLCAAEASASTQSIHHCWNQYAQGGTHTPVCCSSSKHFLAVVRICIWREWFFACVFRIPLHVPVLPVCLQVWKKKKEALAVGSMPLDYLFHVVLFGLKAASSVCSVLHTVNRQ